MGGWNSGRYGGRPTVEAGLTLNFPLMMKQGWVRAGQRGSGSLHWSRRGEPFASIGYTYDLGEPNAAWLNLNFDWTPSGGEKRKVEQRIELTYTYPNYGGRRWWLLCPYTGQRVSKLHLPPGGGKFASRRAWRLGYRSQRVAPRDKPSERLFRLQRKLGSVEGWEAGLVRPKGMWHRTFERHFERYLELDEAVGAEMAMLVLRLGGHRFG